MTPVKKRRKKRKGGRRNPAGKKGSVHLSQVIGLGLFIHNGWRTDRIENAGTVREKKGLKSADSLLG